MIGVADGLRVALPIHGARHIRYVSSVYFTRTVLFTLVALAIILTLDAATHLTRVVEGQGPDAHPPWTIGAYYLSLRALYVLPSLLPVAAFAGPLWAEHSLAASLERIMISNSGRSSFEALLPALLFGALVGITQFYLLAQVRPAVSEAQGGAGFRYFGPYYEQPYLSAPRWIALEGEMINTRIRFDSESVALQEVYLYTLAADSEVSQVVAAREAVPEGSTGVWVFRQGSLWETTSRSRPQAMEATPYAVYRRPLPLDPLWLTHSRVPPELLPQEVLGTLAHRVGVPERHAYEAANQQRYAAIPGAIGMSLVAAALSMLLFGPSTAPRQIIKAALAGGSAYVALIALPMIGASGAAPSALAAWIVPVMLIVAAICIAAWSELGDRVRTKSGA